MACVRGNAVVSANGGARQVALETQIKRFARTDRRRLLKFVRVARNRLTGNTGRELIPTGDVIPVLIISDFLIRHSNPAS